MMRFFVLVVGRQHLVIAKMPLMGELLIKCCGFSEGCGAMALSNLGVRMLGIKSKNGVPFGNLPSQPASCSVS